MFLGGRGVSQGGDGRGGFSGLPGPFVSGHSLFNLMDNSYLTVAQCVCLVYRERLENQEREELKETWY